VIPIRQHIADHLEKDLFTKIRIQSMTDVTPLF
jgi:hypothetical protein